MSFLNPVNEPVLRFKSTDADAPQINYNARVAGDVKAVLKACLVTGYGATASAGWTATNEVGHVAEFVSPSASMSDYRLGIDDTSTSKTDWYYLYQNAKVVPANSAPTKSFSNVDKSNASNGWQLIVTSQGVLFIEIVYHTPLSKLATRINYFSRIKSALKLGFGENILFFNVGHTGQLTLPRYIYSSNYPHLSLQDNKSAQIYSGNIDSLAATSRTFGVSSVDMISPLYAASADKKVTLGEIPGLLSVVCADSEDMYIVSETNLGGRPVLKFTVGYNSNAAASIDSGAVFMVYLDYWEY